MRFVIHDSPDGASGFKDAANAAGPLAAASPAAVKPGRPTREQAQARHAELLDRALDHFLERGFEQATIEAIAADVSMTKRTVYARYSDKAALFMAAVRRGIEKLELAPERIAATRAEDLAETLGNIARLRIDLVATEQGQKLQRIVNTESYRFPAIFTMYYELATQPTVQFLADLLAEESARGELAIDDPSLAANVFLSMVVSGPVRFILSGNPLRPQEVERRIAFGVTLFLQGARPR